MRIHCSRFAFPSPAHGCLAAPPVNSEASDHGGRGRAGAPPPWPRRRWPRRHRRRPTRWGQAAEHSPITHHPAPHRPRLHGCHLRDVESPSHSRRSRGGIAGDLDIAFDVRSSRPPLAESCGQRPAAGLALDDLGVQRNDGWSCSPQSHRPRRRPALPLAGRRRPDAGAWKPSGKPPSGRLSCGSSSNASTWCPTLTGSCL